MYQARACGFEAELTAAGGGGLSAGIYRKYRSLGTPSRLTFFQARLPQNPKGCQCRKGRFSKDLVESFL